MADFSVATFRTLGNAASPQNLFTIENPSGSGKTVKVRRLSGSMDATAVLTAVSCQFKTFRTSALPSGGTTLTIPEFVVAGTNPVAVCRGATASDGGAATAITATASGGALWHQMAMRFHTAVGQMLPDDLLLLPALCVDTPVELAAGEALVVQVLNATAANNAATNHYVVNCAFREV